MPVVPEKIESRIVWYEDHLAPFSTNAVAIGTSAPAVADLTTKVEAARAAYAAQSAALTAAKAATANLQTAMFAMSNAGAAIIEQVRAKARFGGDAIFNLAQIPVPATPSWPGTPGTPSNFKATLNALGGLDLSWKCTNPAAGTMYTVWRKIGDGPSTCLANCGEKKCVDATLPAGTAQVTYQIQAQRTTGAGAWATFVVNIGVAGEAPTVAQSAVKIAA